MQKSAGAAAVFRCVIMGPPGAGKGTISQRILEHFPIKHLSCGDLLRTHVVKKTGRFHKEYGVEAARYMNAGRLVPNEIIYDMMLSEVKKIEHKNWLLDGFPRTVDQAKMLCSWYTVNGCLEVSVPFDVIMERLSKRWIHADSGRIYNLDFNPPQTPGIDDVTGEPLTQRVDDNPATLMLRWENYKMWEQPVHDYYRDKKLLTTFRGRETNVIWPEVHKFLSQHLKPTKLLEDETKKDTAKAAL